eukprot:TRINITY_DN32244_c0_g1_i4.p2 TRINITY_DN32244_c0_g1~~TRINITY_DN32244_c0_g1_i4.p2  ORF type:complete len:167 (-),score=33.54 TRINITY_DN32244_c0_g1_i4:622-1122(-)
MAAKTIGEFLRDFQKLSNDTDVVHVRRSLSLLREKIITDDDLQQLLFEVMQSSDGIQLMCMAWLYAAENPHKRDVAMSSGFAEFLFNKTNEKTRSDEKSWHMIYKNLLCFWLKQAPPCRHPGFYKFVLDPLIDVASSENDLTEESFLVFASCLQVATHLEETGFSE